ncbi:unnamed protein product [Parnassius apollo]|uniref:(apollo) hypothetical protein n=1 Tax=Parnassius apollo TaxID=110799 RepID=A0A8S3WNT1_PARAO|nr:unnamed protein product [Parnassius apollo]
MNKAGFDWLIAARSYQDFKHVNKILNETSVTFDENIVGAYPIYKQKFENEMLELCNDNFSYETKSSARGDGLRTVLRLSNSSRHLSICRYGNKDYNCVQNKIKYGYYHSSERFKNLIKNSIYSSNGKEIPLLGSGILNYNYSRHFNMMNASQLFLNITKWNRSNLKNTNTRMKGFYLIQFFKLRINSTLYGSFLGVWDKNQSMSLVEQPYPVEARKFMGEQLIFGRCNLTEEAGEIQEEGRPLAPALLDDVLYFLTARLNTTPSMRYYNKLGYRSYEGTWTGLLGALMDNSIDMALELVTSHSSKHQDMDFIFPISETMFNIYIRDQETSAVRDIFLAPFSPRLLGCVLVIALASAVVILLISRITPSLMVDRPMGFTEAFIWSIGILCQQGGTQTPSNSAASVSLIVCLLFALVTYNSYAAFITSVLSVRVASVDTISAVLQSSNLKIGYIRNGPDQMYLMSTKDAQLNAFYIRGYSEAENLVSSAEEGLLRAAKEDYAFFSEQRAARITLRSLSQARGRCSLRELAVPSTRAQLAFPLTRGSPYGRPVLVSLLQLRGSGVLARLEAALVPSMPMCAPPPRFASARATDVRSALILFLIGLISALLTGVGEYCWKKRTQLQKYTIACCTRLRNVFE